MKTFKSKQRASERTLTHLETFHTPSFAGASRLNAYQLSTISHKPSTKQRSINHQLGEAFRRCPSGRTVKFFLQKNVARNGVQWRGVTTNGYEWRTTASNGAMHLRQTKTRRGTQKTWCIDFRRRCLPAARSEQRASGKKKL